MERLTIVTGGSRGIGAAISRRLAVEGHSVVVGYRRDEDAAAATVERIRAAGGEAVALRVDTTDDGSVRDFFAGAADIGPLTGLVNNAGSVSAIGRLADLDMTDVRRDLDVNLAGVILCSQHAVRSMGRGGAIVNISSAAATLGSAGSYVHYAAAKAGVEAFTVGLSKEVAADGIRVNAVAPGTVWSDFHADPDRPAKVAEGIPMGRAGEPDEIAGAVAWLLSDDAAYATGTVIRVAGGM